MPHGSTHKRQGRKNYLLLGLLVGVVVLLYALTMVKMGTQAGQDAQAVPAATAE